MLGSGIHVGTNIQQYDLNASDATWYGPTDYKAAYLKLWGIS